MKPTTLHREGDHLRTFAFVLEPDEDPIAVLTAAANDYHLASSQITGVGGFARATLGYFDRDRRQYLPIPVDDQVEVLSLVGDIAHDGSNRIVHAHCVVGLRDGTTRGGHLLTAAVWPTLEVIVTEWPAFLEKRFDPDLGLPVIASHAPIDPKR